MTSLKDKLIAGLMRRGYRRVDYRSSFYEVFVHERQPNKHIFIGRHGALRSGHSIKDSVVISERAKKKLAEEGERAIHSESEELLKEI